MPTAHQTAVLSAVASHHDGPCPRDFIHKAPGVNLRFLTSTIASCIDRGWLTVPTVGVAAYLLTDAGHAAKSSDSCDSDYVWS